MVKIKVKNKLKGALGRTYFEGTKKRVEINVKAHKGDRRELASTIKHELLHVKYPKMTEKEVYKRSLKTKISLKEQSNLISKLKSPTRKKDTNKTIIKSII